MTYLEFLNGRPARKPGLRGAFVRPPVEWLREQYVDLMRNANNIAREIGCDSKTAWKWLKEAGIDTRGRGLGNPEVHFKKGCISLNKGKRMSDEQREKVRAATIARGQLPCYINGIHWMHVTGRKPWNWKGGITPERQEFYRSVGWKTVAREVWRRDDATCQRCQKRFNGDRRQRTFHIHHIDSFVIVDRRLALDNLILLCVPCHLWVHSKDNVEKVLLGEGHIDTSVNLLRFERRGVAV